jgi:adenosyl cobinamide kinase/adenosyl cobinamide phosphate guanylyltransferase
MSFHITLVTGGIRSGKSTVAERLAGGHGSIVAYLATGSASDAEMERRIAAHRTRRPSNWITRDSGENLVEVIDALPPVDAILLDDLGGLVTRLLLSARSGVETSHRLEHLETAVFEALQRQDRSIVIVTSEVGLTLVPSTELGRQFTDLLGESNQRWATRAHAVYLVIAGQTLRIK